MNIESGTVFLAVCRRKVGAYNNRAFKARVVSGSARGRPGEVILKLNLKIARGLFQPCAWNADVSVVPARPAVEGS